MYSRAARLLFSGCLFLTLVAAGSGLHAAPEWIWLEGKDRFGEEAIAMQYSFAGSVQIKRATLRATGDFSALEISLNGKTVVTQEPYDPPEEVDVTGLLQVNANLLNLSARGVDGPSAIALSLRITAEDGTITEISTGKDWTGTSGEKLETFGTVNPQRWALNRLPEISPFSEYNQWKEALPGESQESLSPLPAGFEIRKIRAAEEGEDSWVSLTMDATGRFLIGKEKRGLLRLTLSEDREEVVSAETVEDTLLECRGLAWTADTLYAHANNSGALYRLRDTTGDDQFDLVEEVQATEGGVGHGRNALVFHDGFLHAIVGDNIAVPPGALRRARPEGGAPAELGHWIRIGEKERAPLWEVMSRGLRNPYGIDFNAEGEAFTYDADNEGDVGLPFYRPTRINHLVSGANYGWHQERGNTRNFPVYAPDSVPTTFDAGRGSPTGVRFGGASHFPAPWNQALFALDWAYGRILAIHLTPNGGSYLGSGEVFLEGRPLNVTDLVFDAQGAMWFVTGGRKTRSTLYRVQYNGTPEESAAMSPQGIASVEFSRRARELRRKLEGWHGNSDPEAVGFLWPHLGSPDPWIRNAARVALEWQPVSEWRERALKGEADRAGLTALLALVRAGTDGDRDSVSEVLSHGERDSIFGRINRLLLLRIYELAGVPSDAEIKGRILDQLEALSPDPNDSVNRELARALVQFGSPDATSFSLVRLADAQDQMERLHYLEALSEAGSGWTDGERTRFFQALVQARRVSHGDRFLEPFFQTLEESALSRLTAPEREGFAALLKEPESTGEYLPKSSRVPVKHWTLNDLSPDPESSEVGDAGKGREVFKEALCAACHVCGTTGRSVGPDLTTVANRYSRRDLLEAILDPSAVVAEIHRNLIVTKTDGSVVQGRIVRDDFRDSTITLSVNPFAPAELVTLPKSEIRDWEESAVSPMPPSLLDTFERAEINDLLQFLLSGGM